MSGHHLSLNPFFKFFLNNLKIYLSFYPYDISLASLSTVIVTNLLDFLIARKFLTHFFATKKIVFVRFSKVSELIFSFISTHFQIPASVLDDFDEAASDDGLIDLESFRRVLNSKVAETGSEEEVQLMFDLYDFDRNQKVGVSDMVRIHNMAFPNEKPDLDRIQEIINWGDLDRDGQLNYSEFKTAVTKYEAHIDPRSRRTRE